MIDHWSLKKSIVNGSLGKLSRKRLVYVLTRLLAPQTAVANRTTPRNRFHFQGFEGTRGQTLHITGSSSVCQSVLSFDEEQLDSPNFDLRSEISDNNEWNDHRNPTDIEVEEMCDLIRENLADFYHRAVAFARGTTYRGRFNVQHTLINQKHTISRKIFLQTMCSGLYPEQRWTKINGACLTNLKIRSG